MFIENKYTKWYYQIIDNRKANTLSEYTEKHHIIPRSLGGNNNLDNLVSLTPREHYICHLLLSKMVSGDNKRKMTFAIWTMMRTRDIKINSRLYSSIRELSANQLSILQKGKKTGPNTPEQINNKRISAIKRYQNPEEREKQRILSTGRKHSPETILKMKGPRPKLTDTISQEWMITYLNGEKKYTKGLKQLFSTNEYNKIRKWCKTNSVGFHPTMNLRVDKV